MLRAPLAPSRIGLLVRAALWVPLGLALTAGNCDGTPPQICAEPPATSGSASSGGNGGSSGTFGGGGNLGSGGVQPELVNGNLDSANLYYAVACEGGGTNADGSTNPCASATLVAPDFVLTAHHVGFSVGRPLWFGANPRTAPDFGVTAVACYEFRLSGPAACCQHVPPSDPTYQQYLQTCPQPLAANDYVLTDTVLWQLDRPVTETAPIRIATKTPAGTNVLGDLNGTAAIFVGLGSYDACENEQTLSGTRRWGQLQISGSTGDYYGVLGSGDSAPWTLSMLTAEYKTSWAYTAAGDSGGPLLVDYGPAPAEGTCAPLDQLRIVGTATQGCNYSFGSTLYPQVAEGIRTVLGAANVD